MKMMKVMKISLSVSQNIQDSEIFGSLESRFWNFERNAPGLQRLASLHSFFKKFKIKKKNSNSQNSEREREKRFLERLFEFFKKEGMATQNQKYVFDDEEDVTLLSSRSRFLVKTRFFEKSKNLFLT